MALAEKTVRFVFPVRKTTLATNTTLATATEHDFGDITIQLPESSKTFRSVVVRLTHRMGTTTTARRLDGVRIGVQIDAVSPAGNDATGTGVAATGDPYSHVIDYDATAHFVNNYSGTSHTFGVTCRYEHDVADVVYQITCEVFITYTYQDTSADQIKTVSLPLEGLTTWATITANTNIRGTAAAGQIPALDTYLPEGGKVYRQIWLEISATDGGAATTDFNINYSISGSTTEVGATIEQGLNGSARWYDLWNITSVINTASVQDFQAWSSLANTFEGLHAVLHITYQFNLASTTRVMNSVRLAINSDFGMIMGTASTARQVYDNELVINEPGTITIKQSGAQVFYGMTSGTNVSLLFEGAGKAGGAQTTFRTYVGNALTHAGSRCILHRLDLAHGGTALTLARGRNVIRMSVYSSSATNAVQGLSGWYYINYESDVSSAGIGAHNRSVMYHLGGGFNQNVSGAVNQEFATANQRTPIISQADYYLSGVAWEFHSFTSTANFVNLYAEVLSGESGKGDGWAKVKSFSHGQQAEVGWITNICDDENDFVRKYPNDLYRPNRRNILLNIETARIYRYVGNAILHPSINVWLTMHNITGTVAASVSGSGGSTVNISLISADRNIVLDKTSRVGNGAYSFTWYDLTEQVFTEARENGVLIGRSDTSTPV
jgi:hypothetical protein